MIDLFSRYSSPTLLDILPWIVCLVLLTITIWLFYKSRKTAGSVASSLSIDAGKEPQTRLEGEDESSDKKGRQDGTRPLSSHSADRTDAGVCDHFDNPVEKRSDHESPIITALNLRTFLDLAMVYKNQYDDLLKSSRRKLAAGQIEELTTTLKSESMVKLPQQAFLKQFDEAVLKMVPGYVDKVNELFETEKRITLDSTPSLTPELRIAAMISLCQYDSQIIATTLGLSLNTVYTYRNRLKSRALNRDNFESDLRKLLP